MNYNVTKVEAKTVQKQGQNFGKKYVECTIVAIQKDEAGNDIAGEQRVTPLFDTAAEPYLACISIQKGGTAQADTPIPAHLAKWMYCFDQEFVFPEPMVRVNEQGQPLLNKFQQMYVRTQCTVLTRYQYDEQLALLNPGGSALSPMRGWDKTTRGTSVMNSFYMPYRLFNGAQNGGVVAQPAGVAHAQTNAAGDIIPV